MDEPAARETEGTNWIGGEEPVGKEGSTSPGEQHHWISSRRDGVICADLRVAPQPAPTQPNSKPPTWPVDRLQLKPTDNHPRGTDGEEGWDWPASDDDVSLGWRARRQ